MRRYARFNFKNPKTKVLFLMKKPTAADIYYVEKNSKLGVSELAKATGLTNSQIKNLLLPQTKGLEISPPKGKSQFDTSLAKHPSRKGVVMMTEGASQAADDSRTSNKAKDTSSFITKAKR